MKKLLDFALIGVWAVFRLNTVIDIIYTYHEEMKEQAPGLLFKSHF